MALDTSTVFTMEQAEQIRLVRAITKHLARRVDGNDSGVTKRLLEMVERIASA